MSRLERTVCVRCGCANYRPTEEYAQAVGCWQCGRRLPVRAPEPTLREWIGWTLLVAIVGAVLYWWP